jgi:hypothetical protein
VRAVPATLQDVLVGELLSLGIRTGFAEKKPWTGSDRGSSSVGIFGRKSGVVDQRSRWHDLKAQDVKELEITAGSPLLYVKGLAMDIFVRYTVISICRTIRKYAVCARIFSTTSLVHEVSKTPQVMST